ncbi:hypothetical protein BJY00DRAFT_311711 [Aspergillus carlsbadensis]|nr:hypothetical protein BJY00DRAFT_311711 [Aspergillus carlsbadensis]
MRFAGHQVDMVSSRPIPGTMNGDDNDNEGEPGATISKVNINARTQYAVKTNLVLINAGTNDSTQGVAKALELLEGQPTPARRLSSLTPMMDFSPLMTSSIRYTP